MDAVNLSGVWLNFPLAVIPPPPTPPVVVSGGAGSYPAPPYTLTRRLTYLQWLHLLYGPEGPTLEQLSDKRLAEFLEDDDLMVLMML